MICGHIHHAADRDIGGVHYLNCGDWVESCTAILESETGEMEVVRWLPSQIRKDVRDSVRHAGRVAA